MDARCTYLLIDALVVLVPGIFSFHPKFFFWAHRRAFFQTNSVVAAFFIAWDAWFTRQGIWGFNERYVVGWDILQLPLEEILFFICIPFACTFSFFCIKKYVQFSFTPLAIRWIFGSLALALIFLLVVLPFGMYTHLTFLLLAMSILWFLYKKANGFLSTFLLTYLFIVPFFLLVNGVLTGGLILPEPIVWYSHEHIIGRRVIGIPVEDFFYAMLLLVWNAYGFDRLVQGAKAF